MREVSSADRLYERPTGRERGRGVSADGRGHHDLGRVEEEPTSIEGVGRTGRA